MAEARNRGATPKRSQSFKGFEDDSIERSGELNARLSIRKLPEMQELIDKLIEKMERVEKNQVEMRTELDEVKSELLAVRLMNQELKEENESLKKQFKSEVIEVEKQKEEMRQTVKTVQEKQNVWLQQNEGERKDTIRQIMKEQMGDRDELRKGIVRVIKEEKKLVRDVVDKCKCVVVFGLKEEKIINKMEREEKEKEKFRNVLAAAVNDEELKEIRIEETFRIGKFEEGKHRPVKIKFATQTMAEEVLNGSWRLAGKDVFENVWINRDLDEGERRKVKELVAEAKQKNLDRTEEEREKFYWKVIDLQLRRKFFRK